MTEYKNQHFVTEAYLKEWCDPETPEGYEPYVWTVSKKAQTAKNKSPKKIFSETDFYTFIDSKGNRNVDVEKALQRIESDYVAIQRDKISQRKPLDDKDMLIVSTFVATMFARVKKQRDQQIEIWQELLEEINNAPEEMRINLQKTESYDQIRSIGNQPLPYNIINFANIAIPFFTKMSCEIIETKTKPGFITSDNPCFIIDPAIFTPNPPKSWIELFSSPTIEILFPISPKQLISLKPSGPDGYISIDKAPEAVDEVNKIIVGNSEKFIVLNQKNFKDEWFENI